MTGNPLPQPAWTARLFLIVIAAVLPVLWVVVARLGAAADGTLIHPAQPLWGARGVVLAEVAPGFGDLRAGDCVVGVDGIPLERWVSGPGSPGRAAGRPPGSTIATYRVVRVGTGGAGRCTGQAVDVPVRIGRYPLRTMAAAHLGGLPLLLTLFGVGSFVFWRRPQDPAARALFAIAALLPYGITAWPLGMQVVDLLAGPRLWPFLVGDAANGLLWAAMLHFALVFPHPRGVLARRPAAVLAVYALPFGLHGVFMAVTMPSMDGAVAWLAREASLSVPAAYVFPPLIGAAFLRAYRAAAGDTLARQRIRLVLVTFLTAAVCYLGLGQLPTILLGHPLVGWDWQPLFFLPAPLALGAAVLRYRLFDIDVILTRSLLYGALTVLAVGAYLALVMILDRIFGPAMGRTRILAVAAVALAVHPMRSRLHRLVGRLMYGARDDPHEVIARLGRRLDAPAATDRVLPAVVETLAHALRLPYAAIELIRPDGPGIPAVLERAEVGQPTGQPAVIPLTHGGAAIGRLMLDVGRSREPFGPADSRLLETLARQIEVTAHNVLLNRSLQQSLERTVIGREEERRRIRRDIHDGLGPTLAAVGMKLEVIRAVMSDDPAAAEAFLGELIATHQTIIVDLRRLVDGLRPPALDQLGLAAAVAQHARSLDVPGAALGACDDIDDVTGAHSAPRPMRPVEFVIDAAPDLEPLPAAVEIAAYRICLEAMTNVVRHAAASTCTVRIWRKDAAVWVTISDDGVGLAAGHHKGVGWQSLRDRAAELGGTCTVTAGPSHGTTVRARLPLANDQPSRPAGPAV